MAAVSIGWAPIIVPVTLPVALAAKKWGWDEIVRRGRVGEREKASSQRLEEDCSSDFPASLKQKEREGKRERSRSEIINGLSRSITYRERVFTRVQLHCNFSDRCANTLAMID